MTMIMIMAIPNAMHPPITPHILFSARPVRAPALGPINVAVVVSLVRGWPLYNWLLVGGRCVKNNLFVKDVDQDPRVFYGRWTLLLMCF